jgi:mannose-6-phosphate isomerase-like protein (cupin superfamily)
MNMPIAKVSLADKFARFSEQWSPKIAGEINDSYVKLVKFQGDFAWHHHDHEDEMFLVIKGRMVMALRDPEEHEIEVNAGEFIIIPKGVEHRPSAPEETQVVLLEPKTTLNTGNVRDQRTLEKLERI